MSINSRDVLVSLSVKYDGNWDKVYNAITSKEDINEEMVASLMSKVKSDYITILDNNYPDILKQTYKPPFVLFYKGDINLLKNSKTKIAFVGARELDAHHEIICKKAFDDYNDHNYDFDVVLTNAKGTSDLAFNKVKGKKIIVGASGLNNPYPLVTKGNLDKADLVITEYPDDVCADKDNFIMRNRIVACITDKIVVAYATKQSGTATLVEFALQNGKDIYAIPYPFEDTLNNDLISFGAFALTTFEGVGDVK